jgi:hypothetical protein
VVVPWQAGGQLSTVDAYPREWSVRCGVRAGFLDNQAKCAGTRRPEVH